MDNKEKSKQSQKSYYQRVKADPIKYQFRKDSSLVTWLLNTKSKEDVDVYFITLKHKNPERFERVYQLYNNRKPSC